MVKKDINEHSYKMTWYLFISHFESNQIRDIKEEIQIHIQNNWLEINTPKWLLEMDINQ